jgi:iron complex transport system substrate-binding protein
MSYRLFNGLVAIAISSIFFAVPAQAYGKTITVTDTLNRKIELPAKPERILLGFYFEDFYAIGGANAFDKVVAISKSTWHDWRLSQWNTYIKVNPEIAKLIDVGEVDSGTFSIEKAIASKPDVAILAAWQYNALGDVVTKLEAAGIPVVVADYNAQTVEKHVISTLMIGKILGTEQRAKKLADEYAAAVEDVMHRVMHLGGDKPRVYVELGNKGADEYGNSYREGMWGGVIGLAGGNNIAIGQAGQWSPLNPEYVLTSDPEVIFIAGSYWESRDKAVLMGFGVEPETTQSRLSTFLGRPGWSNLSAVKSQQVHALYHGGARTLYDYAFLQYIGKALYPEAFADIDPEETHRRFYETYLPVSAEGVFMTRLKSSP